MSTRIALDSNILIEHFRAPDKSTSNFVRIRRTYDLICIPAVVQFEVMVGINDGHRELWQDITEGAVILPFGGDAIDVAVSIFRQLKRKNKLIELSDLFIAATALANDMPLATLNRSHFERIAGLEIMRP